MLPLEVVDAALCDPVVHVSHRLNDLPLHLRTALNVLLRQEVIRHSHQRLFRPALEPVHRAARDEARELEGAAAELLTNLKRNN